MLRAAPEPFWVIAGCIGDCVDGFSARLLPRERQESLHGFDGCLMRLLVGGTCLAHLTVGQACQSPSRLALVGRYWWAVDGHGALWVWRKPSQLSTTLV